MSRVGLENQKICGQYTVHDQLSFISGVKMFYYISVFCIKVYF